MKQDKSITPNDHAKLSLRDRRVISRAILLWLPFAAVVFLSVAAYEQFNKAHYVDLVKTKDMAFVEDKVSALRFRLAWIEKDILFLARLFEDYKLSHDGKHLATDELETQIASFVTYRKNLYDQVRIINREGQEIVRVNGRGAVSITPMHKLASKKDRYYVKESLALRPGEVFMSRFDLNVEGGQVERPFVPMIRFVTPVADKHGESGELVVINYKGDDLIRRITKQSASDGSQFWMLNRQGYWLYSPDSNQQWGFMLPERSDQRVENHYPDILDRVYSNRESGQFFYQGGLVTYTVFDPSRYLSNSGMSLKAHDEEKWYFFTYLSKEVFEQNAEGIGWFVIVSSSITSLVLLGLVWFNAFASVRRGMVAKEQEESEKQFRSLLESTPDAILVSDVAGRIVLANQQVTLLLGYFPDEMVGQSVEILVPENVRGHHVALRETYANNPRRRSMGEGRDLYAQHKNGSLVPVTIGLNTIELGDEILIISQIRDVREMQTAQRRIEDLNKELEQRNQQILDQIHDSVITTDLNGLINNWNRGAERLFGWSREEMVGKHIGALYPNDQQIFLAEKVIAPLKEKGDHEIEVVMRNRSGKLFYAHLSLSMLYDAHKQPVGMIGYSIDITQQMEAKKAIQASEARYQRAERGANDGLWEWNVPTGEMYYSPRWLEIFGYVPGEIPYRVKIFSDMVHPEDMQRAREAVDAHFDDHQEYNVELRMRHKAGHYVWVRSRGFAERDEFGKPVLMAGSITDITEYKQLVEQLEQEKGKAEEANQYKSQFLANMSHEIRTPMNAILGLAYLLEKAGLPDDAHQMASKICRAGHSLQVIINDILDFSKLEAGKLEIENAPFLLTEILDNLSTIMAASDKNPAVEFVIVPPVMPMANLLGDALRLEQVLINLAGNAIKFTSRGSVVVQIDVVAQSAQQVTLRFAVKDTGIGISEEAQKRLFSAFTQADSSTTRKFGGTGLGLAISRQLVDLMGGQMILTSQEGHGSEFAFELTFAHEQDSRSAQPEMDGLQVLVADDSPIALNALMRSCQAVGWEAQGVNSGEELLTALEQRDPECGDDKLVVVLDWQMPGMDGLTVVQRIQDMCGDKLLPVIMMVTGHDSQKLANEPNAGIANAVLSKPITSSMLYDAVARAKCANGEMSDQRSCQPPGGRRLDGLRLLVVDDSEINRDVALRIFSIEGAQVALAENGQEAVDMLLEDRLQVDIVLMDIQMPVLDGYDATAKIRQQAEFAKLPIVALTAGAFKKDQDKACNAGMDGFIPKPFNVDAAVTTIRLLVAERTTGAEAAQQDVATDAPEAQEAEPEPEAKYPGLDLDMGLMIWRQEEPYKEYLQKFRTDYANLITDLSDESLEASARLAHKVRGAAGNLGLPDLVVALGAFEAQVEDGANDGKALALQMEGVFQTTMASIHAYVVGDGENPNAAP
ncbi:putative sensor/response regulator hybrid [Magnetofaba australis IT-1]|uniref:histidine kinase n=1 Tax=Magnetofaba australis IT-1 TaxID=1434232 RepID=A0A1Y2K9L5_9PROT|nr:putative sensor/response regulator hybrid [Magnetofaba australis IT-1]